MNVHTCRHVYVHVCMMYVCKYVCTYNAICPSSGYLTDRCVNLLHAALQSPTDTAGRIKKQRMLICTFTESTFYQTTTVTSTRYSTESVGIL